MLVDSHCHLTMLDLAEFDGNLDSAMEAAKQAGVEHMLCVAVDRECYPTFCELANKYPQVSISIGVHPNEEEATEATVADLVKLAENPKVVAIGETGLDYYRTEGDAEWQRQRFRNHIHAAKQVNKPLIIHTRQAQQDTMRIMSEEGAKDVGGVMHCFTETWEMAQEALALNFYISFSGIVTFKNATDLQDLAKKVPLDRLLIETDAPYLAPVPYRGKPNQPAYVRHVAQFIADLRNESFATIAQASTENFYRLFKPRTMDKFSNAK